MLNIVKSLEDFGLLIKSTSETIENETKEQKGGFLGGYFIRYIMRWFIGKLLASKRETAKILGWGVISAAEVSTAIIWGGWETTTEGQNLKKKTD